MKKGMGAAMNLASIYISVYYNIIIAYSLYFMFLSLRSSLLWAKCDPAWASPNCIDDFQVLSCNDSNLFRNLTNGKCYYSDHNSTVSIGCKLF
jgi:hypothetical protein